MCTGHDGDRIVAAWEAVDENLASPDDDLSHDAPTCYCGAESVLRKGKYGFFYGCSRFPRCDGLVGCHPESKRPLGTMANKETRDARKRAHDVFDRLWKSAPVTRSWAYEWLRSHVPAGHMGAMTEEEAEEVIDLCESTSPDELLDAYVFDLGHGWREYG